jgi:hypothetical protein
LERIQLACARIITGAKWGTSHELLYNEFGLLPLAERRKHCKLKFMYNLIRNETPQYLFECLPANVNHRHNLRNPLDILTFRCRTEKFKKSFLPDCINLWNMLANPLKQLDSFSLFKSTVCCNPPVNKLYNGVNRKLSLIHSQLRMKCSDLNSHLFNLHVVDNPFCNYCNNVIEDAYHFFFSCPLYHWGRINLLENINEIEPINVTLDISLFGKNELTPENNLRIFGCVEEFINSSGRFNVI